MWKYYCWWDWKSGKLQISRSMDRWKNKSPVTCKWVKEESELESWIINEGMQKLEIMEIVNNLESNN